MFLKPFNLPLILSTLGLILGIFISGFYPIDWLYSVFGVVLMVIFYFIFALKKKKFVNFCCFSLFFSVGFLVYHFNLDTNHPNHYTKKLKENIPYLIEARIYQINEKNVFAYLQSIDNQKVEGNIQISGLKDIKKEEVGKSVLFYSKFFKIEENKNPYQFNYKKYLENRNIFWRTSVNPENFILKENDDFSIFIWAKRLQLKISSSLKKYDFSAESISVIQALLLGIRSDIDQEIYQDYIDAGAVHILAISGLHIGILSLVLQFLLTKIFRKRKDNLLIVSVLISFLWFYALISGFSASVVRAVTMFSFLSIANLSKKRQGVYDNLFLSLFTILIFSPLSLFDVGFQLSYLAVFSIVTFQPVFNRFYYPENRFVRYFYSILSVSFSAQIGVLPISLFYFNQFPSLFFVTNLLVLPIISTIMCLGLLVLVLANFSALPHFLVSIYDKLILILNKIISFVASFESFVLKDIYFDEFYLIFSLLLVIILAFYFHFWDRIFIFLFSGVVLCFQIYIFGLDYHTKKQEKLIVFQDFKSTSLGVLQGKKLFFMQNDSSRISQRYKSQILQKSKLETYENRAFKHIFKIKNASFLILNQSFYLEDLPQVDFLIISETPKVHLERFLNHTKPKKVIITDSNSSFFIKKVESYCKNFKIETHNIKKQGYFEF